MKVCEIGLEWGRSGGCIVSDIRVNLGGWNDMYSI